jgi:hypothetical protein
VRRRSRWLAIQRFEVAPSEGTLNGEADRTGSTISVGRKVSFVEKHRKMREQRTDNT